MSNKQRTDERRQDDADLAPDVARREALGRMGRLAAYTAPVMLTLLGAGKARAQVNGSVIVK